MWGDLGGSAATEALAKGVGVIALIRLQHLHLVASMTLAYSRLKRLLSDRNITMPELQKRIQHRGMHVKSEQWREPVGRWCQDVDRSPMGETMASVVKYQRQLLDFTRSIYDETPIGEAVASVYLKTPRHVFIKRYRQWGTKAWHEVHEANLAEHFGRLYANGPLILFGDDDDVPPTISQPSFVLHMLDMLQFHQGRRSSS